MASLSYKIRAYLDRDINFRSDVILQDDGQGAYIKEWNVPEAQPTVEQLAGYNAQADAIIAEEKVIADRIAGYGGYGDQLDMMYWDEVNGTTTWKDHIAAVKAANPKV